MKMIWLQNKFCPVTLIMVPIINIQAFTYYVVVALIN